MATLQEKIATLRAAVVADSITPDQLGAILQEMLQDSSATDEAMRGSLATCLANLKTLTETSDSHTTSIKSLDSQLKALSDDIGDVSDDLEDAEKTISELQAAVFPIVGTISASPSVIEIGKSTQITVSWTATVKGVNILPSALISSGAPVLQSFAAGTSSFKHTAEPVAPGVITANVIITYGGMNKTMSTTITPAYRSYCGVVAASGAVTEAMVKALSSSLHASRSRTVSGLNLANQRTVFAYAKTYGALTSVKDGNGFENLQSYTRSEIAIDGVAYYLYVLTNPVTASGITQNFA